jgi:protein SCO1/2
MIRSAAIATTRTATLSCAVVLAMLALCSTSGANEPTRPKFELTTSAGQRITQESYPKQWKLVFFGFTHCPDICPLTLLTLKQAMDKLGAEARKVRPLFITVDPARDTSEVLSEYVAHFGASFTAATGSEQQLSAAADAFRAPFYRYDSRDGGYQMSHSGLLYVLDPSGALVATIRNGLEAARLARELDDLIAQDWVESSGEKRSAVPFKSADGEAVDLTKFRGRVALVQAWASWCVPCAPSLQSLDGLQARVGREQLEIVAPAADRSVEVVRGAFDVASIKTLQPYFGLTISALNEWDVASLPTTILVDRNGQEVARLKGYVDWRDSTRLAPVLRALEASD